MDIQQTDKESLATYVHRFKWEANRCKFDNDAATIWIFLKGLRNVHTIATKVYEKGPQTLSETIREVEKLQAAQQITSSLLPASSVNTMSSDNDRCFQCKEVGHMARYCPHIRCYDCNSYGHVAMVCPDKILPSGTPAHHRTSTNNRSRRSSSRHNSHTHHSHHEHRNRSRFSRSRSQTCDHSYWSNSHHNPCRSQSRSFHRSSQCHFSCDRSSSSYHCHHDTPHHRHSNSRDTSRDDSRSHHRSRKHHYRLARGSPSSSHTASWKSKDRKHKQVTFDDLPSDYYDSDDNDSNSDDDLN